MTRTILAGLAAAASRWPCRAPACQSTGVGDPCMPEQEYDPTFAGFVEQEVSIEGESFQCQTRLCLVNHFQGRVTCPYGQDATGNADRRSTATAARASRRACPRPVDRSGSTAQRRAGRRHERRTVLPQCTERTRPDRLLLVPLRGHRRTQTDGANFCNCPSGFSCTQLVSSLGAGRPGPDGAYCIKSGTAFDSNARRDHLHDRAAESTAPNCGTGDEHRREVTRAELGRRAELAVADYLFVRGLRSPGAQPAARAARARHRRAAGSLLRGDRGADAGPGSFWAPSRASGRASGPRPHAPSSGCGAHGPWMKGVERVRIDVAAVSFEGGETQRRVRRGGHLAAEHPVPRARSPVSTR